MSTFTELYELQKRENAVGEVRSAVKDKDKRKAKEIKLEKQGSKETRKQGNKLFNKQTTLSSKKKIPREEPKIRPLTITIEPDPPHKHRLYRKQTFEFSPDDLDFLDEMKFKLRKLSVTKNDIVRTGLEVLKKDYQKNKETSFLVRKFGMKQGSKETSF